MALPTQAPVTPPAQLAQVHANEAIARHANATNHPELNGYFELIKVPAAKHGTAALYDIYRKRGSQALFAAVDGGAGEKLEPFVNEIRKIEGITKYQYLTVPVQVPSIGPLVMADDSKFLDALKGLALAPVLDARQATLDPEYEANSIDYAVMAVQAGRKVAFQASCLAHQTFGLELQSEGMTALENLLKSNKLTVAQIGDLIVGLQTVEGNERDFVRVADAEYLSAVRRFENQGLDDSRLAKELNGLAARYLRIRPLFEKHGVAPPNLADLPPEAKGCQMVGKEPDLLGPYNRWRAAATRLSALEIRAALELYRSAHKSYPDTLTALRGKQLTRMPKDFFSQNGQFAYSKEGKTFRLETVSPDVPGAKSGRRRW
jgi:hypothetical protein